MWAEEGEQGIKRFPSLTDDLLTKHAKRFPYCGDVQPIVVSNAIAKTAKDETENKSEQVWQTR